MDAVRASRISGGNSAYGRVESDLYPTPPDVTFALLEFLKPMKGTVVWEPASGEGHMAAALRLFGLEVVESDIQRGEDFLKIPKKECDWIITNPPFSCAEEFVLRCAEHQVPFALLLKSQYWHAKKRLPLFERAQPDFVLPLTWRPDFLFGTRGKGRPLMDVMWVVWGPMRGACGTHYRPLSRPKIEMEGK